MGRVEGSHGRFLIDPAPWLMLRGCTCDNPDSED